MRTISAIIIFLLLISDSFGKMFERRARVIHMDEKTSYNDPWVRLESSPKKSFLKVVELMRKSKAGDKIWLKAKEKWENEGRELWDVFRIGQGSVTDTTLIRKYSPSEADAIVYETRSLVYLNKSHNVRDAILDLAHELTHFTLREFFNPYKMNFTLKGFVKSTVEGKGGEVDAYLVECKVYLELFGKKGQVPSDCHRVMDGAGRLSRKKGVQAFYRIGQHFRRFREKMIKHAIRKRDLPHVTDNTANFISSAYGVPYPLAAVMEYESIMGRACENDQKRLSVLMDSSRLPASEDNQIKNMKNKLKRRCRPYLIEI